MKTHRLFALTALLLAGSACMMTTTQTVSIQVDNEISMKDSWKAFITEHPTPKIVLRVPGYTKEVTRAEMTETESLYNFIEKKFLQAQFTVRDRTLLLEVLSHAGTNLSYSEIRNRVDTDIMLEIVSTRTGLIPGMMLVEGAAAPPAATTINGVELQGRIILVETGELVGMFTLREIHPAVSEFDSYQAASADPKLAGVANSWLEQIKARTPEMWDKLANKLVDLLKGNTVASSRVSKTRAVMANTW